MSGQNGAVAPQADLTTDAPSPQDGPPSRSALGWSFRVVAGLVVVASFAVWIYAFSGLARRDPPDLLDSPEFAQQAEPICAAALADIEQMPGALDADDGQERADQIVATTTRFETMLDQLDELASNPAVSTSERDREITSGWLADWRVLVDDRYDYADRIAEDPAAQFLLTNTGIAERLDRRITRVADTNHMPSCGAPGDVG